MVTNRNTTGSELERLVEILKRLRAPDGCPWDKEQTHQSLRPYLIEETYEVLDTIDREAFAELKKELGDLLLHIVFHAQIATESNLFDMNDVIHALNEKLVHRHPHVFGDAKVETAGDVNRQWEKIKLNESHRPKLLDGVPANQPALNRAFRVQEKAAAVGFDWPNVEPIWNKIDEEVVELKREVDAESRGRMEAEFGDLLFSMVNLGRKLGISPEDALRTSITKFCRRFAYIEEKIESDGKTLHDTNLDTMDQYWDEAKRMEDHVNQMTKANRKSDRSVGFDRRHIEDDSQQSVRLETREKAERAMLVGIHLYEVLESTSREYLDELDMLAQTAGADVVVKEFVKLRKRDPALFIGKGKADELAEYVKESRADLVIFDEDLSPVQGRNLEGVLSARVLDRAALILDIFAKRARTREAKTQVELAQLRYMLPRLSGAWKHLERQQGGIGMRGPGETQIETDRRIVRTRIRQLESELGDIERVHKTQRKTRDSVYRFSLAGYTNVGKSTLMNVLTHAGVYEEDLLFATLDSTTRALPLGSKLPAVVSDTVGFIRKLPPGLVASFRSTLAEISEADCVLHVVDIASLSFREQMEEVDKILNEMGLKEKPRLNVFNKVDALEDDEHLRWARKNVPDGIFISARRGIGKDLLLDRMKAVIQSSRVVMDVDIPAGDGKLLSELYRVADVSNPREVEGGLRLTVSLDPVSAARLGLRKL